MAGTVKRRPETAAARTSPPGRVVDAGYTTRPMGQGSCPAGRRIRLSYSVVKQLAAVGSSRGPWPGCLPQQRQDRRGPSSPGRTDCVKKVRAAGPRAFGSCVLPSVPDTDGVFQTYPSRSLPVRDTVTSSSRRIAGRCRVVIGDRRWHSCGDEGWRAGLRKGMRER